MESCSRLTFPHGRKARDAGKFFLGRWFLLLCAREYQHSQGMFGPGATAPRVSLGCIGYEDGGATDQTVSSFWDFACSEPGVHSQPLKFPFSSTAAHLKRLQMLLVCQRQQRVSVTVNRLRRLTSNPLNGQPQQTSYVWWRIKKRKQ